MTILFYEDSEAYHASAALGSTDIRRMVESARLFADGLEGICDRRTKALLFGTTSHLRLLEPQRFATEVVFKPAGMSFATTEGKAWRAKQGDRLIVEPKDAEHLCRMHERMPGEVAAIFALCRKEVTVRTEIDGLAVQCRPDLWNIEARAFYDLKTIDDISGIRGAIWSRRYDVQVRWYTRLIEHETGNRVSTARLIFAEKAPPYRWRVVELDLDYETLADKAIDDAIAQIKARNNSGCWDDAADLHAIAYPPEWAGSALTVNADGGIDL